MHVCVYQLIHCSDLLCALLSWIYTYICHCSVQVETALGTVNLANQNANQLPVPSLKAGTLTQKTWSDCSLSGGHTKTKQQLLTINTCTKKSPTCHMTSPGHDQSRAWPVPGMTSPGPSARPLSFTEFPRQRLQHWRSPCHLARGT